MLKKKNNILSFFLIKKFILNVETVILKKSRKSEKNETSKHIFPLALRETCHVRFPPVLPSCPKECLVLYNKEQEQWTSTVSNNRHLRFVSLFSFFSSFLRKKYIIMLFTEQNNFYNVNMMPRKKERQREEISVLMFLLVCVPVFRSQLTESGHCLQIEQKCKKNIQKKKNVVVVRINDFFYSQKKVRDHFFMNCFFNESLYLSHFYI